MRQKTLTQKAMQTFRKEGIGDLLRETRRYAGRRLLPYEPAAKYLL